MVGRNNRKVRYLGTQKPLPRYAIRRLHLGAASVVVGGLLSLGVAGHEVLADEVTTDNEGSAETSELAAPETIEADAGTGEEVVDEKTEAQGSKTSTTSSEVEQPETSVEAEKPEQSETSAETEAPKQAEADPVETLQQDSDEQFIKAHEESYKDSFATTKFEIDESLETNPQGFEIDITEGDGDKPALTVRGKDADGLFYGINEVDNKLLYGEIKETEKEVQSPKFPIRGVIEGFYGKPWSHQGRKDLFEFLGKNGLNTYIYSPKDDPYLRDKWKETYPEEDVAQLKDLVETATKNHVDFVYVISPGLDIEYSSNRDFQNTVNKFDSLRKLGVKQFYIALDDIDKPLKGEDVKNYGDASNKKNIDTYVHAQADYVNRLQKNYVKANGLPDLWIVPTDYTGSGTSEYKQALKKYLDKDIRIQWTGEGVFADKIEVDSIKKAKESYGSEHIFFWDNYPVNDNRYGRLFLRPIFGRDPKLAGETDGFTANPLIEPYASCIAIKSYADYLWDPEGYDPEQSLKESIAQIAGEDEETQKNLAAFVDLNQSWDPANWYKPKDKGPNAPILSKYVKQYQQALAKEDEEAYQVAKEALLAHLTRIEKLPETLKQLKEQGFYQDAEPWIKSASANATRNKAAVALLDFNRHKDQGAKLDRKFVDQLDEYKKIADAQKVDGRDHKETVKVGDGVFAKLVGQINPIRRKLTEDDFVDTATETEEISESTQKLIADSNATLKESFAKTNFAIDPKLDANEDGYHLQISEGGDGLELTVTGKDDDGVFYGVSDVLRRIDLGKVAPTDEVQSPAFPIRGVIEGFYGKPWSHQGRKDLFEFLGKNGLNTYIYSPKNDPYLRAKWKETYPEEDVAQLKDLVDTATKNHVDFVYVLSPGNDIVYSSDEDYQNTINKFESLRKLGVKQFYIALDDLFGVTLKGADREKYKTSGDFKSPQFAQAQVDYLNKIQRDYIKPNGLPDLWIVPSDYAGTALTPHKAVLHSLDKDIRIQWTGNGVFANTISEKEVEAAKKAYGSDHIFLWDNYPVNDQAYGRLFLRPIFGRDPKLAGVTDGFTSNPLIEPYASWIAIKSYADYLWDPENYDPEQSLKESIVQIAGEDEETQKNLAAFVDLNQSWEPERDANPNGLKPDDDLKAPVLAQLVKEYQQALAGEDEEAYQAAKDALLAHLTRIEKLPETLKKLKVQGFYQDAEPWIKAAAANATQNKAAVALLDFDRHKDQGAKLDRKVVEQLDAAKKIADAQQVDARDGKKDTVKVGDGVFGTLVGKIRPIRNHLTEDDFAPEGNASDSDVAEAIERVTAIAEEYRTEVKARIGRVLKRAGELGINAEALKTAQTDFEAALEKVQRYIKPFA